MKELSFEKSTITRVASSAIAMTLTMTASVSAATFALNFTGTANAALSSGNFATEIVPLNAVTGSILIDDNLDFMTSTSSGSSGTVNEIVGVTNMGSGTISATVSFGTITEFLTAPGDNSIGQFGIQEGATSLLETVSVNVTRNDANPSRFDFFLRDDTSSDLVSQNASLGFSRSLLESINLSAADITQGEINFSANGTLIFSIDSLAIREVNAAPVNPVPLPAGLPFLLSGLGGVLLLKRRKS